MNGVEFGFVSAVGGAGLKFAFPEHRATMIGDDRARGGTTLEVGGGSKARTTSTGLEPVCQMTFPESAIARNIARNGQAMRHSDLITQPSTPSSPNSPTHLCSLGAHHYTLGRDHSQRSIGCSQASHSRGGCVACSCAYTWLGCQILYGNPVPQVWDSLASAVCLAPMQCPRSNSCCKECLAHSEESKRVSVLCNAAQ